MKKNIFLLLISIIILFTSCNSEGNGIFFQISQEVKQITSEISDIPVHQVVEAGGELYVRTGRKVWVRNGSSWKGISMGNFIYNIVEYSGTLYGVINNDDTNLDDGKIMSFDGSNWILVDNYNTDLKLIKANDTYVLVKGIGGADSIATSSDPSNMPDNESIIDYLIDGASHTAGGVNILISTDDLYGITIGSLDSVTVPSPATKSGDFCGITVDANDDFYLTTSTGQIFRSIDDGVTWTSSGTISNATPVSGSLEVVTIGAKEYLIIGTEDGYYEMNITDTGSVVAPTQTTTETEFETAYPELATSLIYEVYPSGTPDVFYLATENGLWKRNTTGTFSKQ